MVQKIISGHPIDYIEEFNIVSPANPTDFQKAIQLKVNEIIFQKLSKALPVKINEKWYIKKNKDVVLPKFAMAKPNDSKNEHKHENKNANENIAIVSTTDNTWHATFNVKFVYEYEEIDEDMAIALAMHLKSATEELSKEKTI